MSDEREPLGVTISAREIYDQIVGLRDDVRTLTQTNVHVDQKLDDHEQRIRAVERWKFSVPAAAVTAVVSAAITIGRGTGKI